MQNKGYYIVQGHSRSPMSVPMERPYATFYTVFQKKTSTRIIGYKLKSDFNNF